MAYIFGGVFSLSPFEWIFSSRSLLLFAWVLFFSVEIREQRAREPRDVVLAIKKNHCICPSECTHIKLPECALFLRLLFSICSLHDQILNCSRNFFHTNTFAQRAVNKYTFSQRKLYEILDWLCLPVQFVFMVTVLNGFFSSSSSASLFLSFVLCRLFKKNNRSFDGSAQERSQVMYWPYGKECSKIKWKMKSKRAKRKDQIDQKKWNQRLPSKSSS